ncbi:MAG: methanethiol S-methyltransferase [Burkholderiales bacterium]|jgi:protein-S-isoprenylcysteine O-methyltransferase Ste14
MLKRSFALIYGAACYALFVVTFLYAVGFVGDFIVPRSIDSTPLGDFWSSLGIDFALLALFAVQHSGMARKGFKRWLTRFVAEPIERSTYVLASSAALIVLFAFWQPLGGVLWSVEDPLAVGLLRGLCAAGWLTVLAATFLINHFDLFGLRQVWLYARSQPYRPLEFRTPGLYRLIRHPLYFGFIVAFWATPTMTVAHLVFALATTIYILIAIQLEERDLVANLGEAYRAYRRQVPMIVPFTGDRDAPGIADEHITM